MTHADDKGLVLPPKAAPSQIVIVPIYKSNEKEKIVKKANEIKSKLKGYDVELDDRDGYTPGWKFNEWELKGVPLRIEIGPKDIAKNQVIVVRRDNNNKVSVPINKLDTKVKETLDKIQNDLFNKAKKFLNSNITGNSQIKGKISTMRGKPNKLLKM